MSWKPCIGSGNGFDNAQRRERKYRYELNVLINNPDATIKAISKAYYHLLVALRDQQNYFGGNYPIRFGVLIPYMFVERMRSHKDLCYKPLQSYIQ